MNLLTKNIYWKNKRQVFISLLGMLGITLLLSGCNTVEGFGKDVEDAGERIEDAAD